MPSPFSRVILLLAVLGTRPLSGGEKPAVPADFRVAIELREVAPETQAARAELLAYKGRALEIIDGQHELVLIDPIARRVELLNLDLKAIGRLSFDRLDAETAAYRKRLQRTVDTLSASDRRAEKLNAAKTADLLAPRGELSYDAATHRVARTGTTTEFTAVGIPDDDRARLDLVRQSLVYLLKLDAYRAPGKIPPFVQLQAIDAIVNEHHLRPSDMTFLYRLNGPPVRFRWTYRMEPALTAKDVELWTKLENFLKTAEVMDIDEYEKAVTKPLPRPQPLPAGRSLR